MCYAPSKRWTVLPTEHERDVLVYLESRRLSAFKSFRNDTPVVNTNVSFDEEMRPVSAGIVACVDPGGPGGNVGEAVLKTAYVDTARPSKKSDAMIGSFPPLPG